MLIRVIESMQNYMTVFGNFNIKQLCGVSRKKPKTAWLGEGRKEKYFSFTFTLSCLLNSVTYAYIIIKKKV